MKHIILASVFLFLSSQLFAQSASTQSAAAAAPAPAVVETDNSSKITLLIDYDLKFRALSYSNVDYTRPSNDKLSDTMFLQYLALEFNGQFDNRIDMNARVASYGISGRANNVFISPYLNNDYPVFLETAYLTYKSDSKSEIPFSLHVGKQDIYEGSGLIIGLINNGLVGMRGEVDFFNLFALEAFASKVDAANFDVYGGNIKLKTVPTFELGVYREYNDSGWEYEKGVRASTTSGYDDKTFYNFRIYSQEAKYKYNIEFAKQGGERFVSSTESVKYDSLAILIEGGLSGKIFNMDSNAEVLFSYTDSKNGNVFNPTFARRYNGIGRVGFGNLFAANNADSFLILPDGIAGINTLGAKFDIFPWKFLQAGAGLYLYFASDAPPDASGAGLAEVFGAKADLGSEFDFFVKYFYQKYFDAGLNFSVYAPPSDPKNVFANHDNSYLIQFEVNAKF
ncbi:hypothetical protein [Endomicrobium proavitum]|uniref:Alginate export domain-containing protein n=1 Tax=Endomicrobium proavitum TaxID=1408281 RepID=A0A0G3WJ24_9BACT|nr:hypothetical protein [Endomicrobium proavitum]AKL97895.1 exported protein of unknown function [Endomicrobium proavitum]